MRGLVLTGCFAAIIINSQLDIFREEMVSYSRGVSKERGFKLSFAEDG